MFQVGERLATNKLHALSEPLLVLFLALVRRADDNHDAWSIGMFHYLQFCRTHHFIGVFLCGAVTASQVHSSVMWTHLVLVLRGGVGIKHTAPFTHTASNLRKVVNHRLCLSARTFNSQLSGSHRRIRRRRCDRVDYWGFCYRSKYALRRARFSDDFCSYAINGNLSRPTHIVVFLRFVIRP